MVVVTGGGGVVGGGLVTGGEVAGGAVAGGAWRWHPAGWPFRSDDPTDALDEPPDAPDRRPAGARRCGPRGGGVATLPAGTPAGGRTGCARGARAPATGSTGCSRGTGRSGGIGPAGMLTPPRAESWPRVAAMLCWSWPIAALSAAIWLDTWAAVPAEASGAGVVPTAQAMVIPVTPAVAAATTDEDTTLLRLRWRPRRGAGSVIASSPVAAAAAVLGPGRRGGGRRLGGRGRRGGRPGAGWSARSSSALVGRRPAGYYRPP